jgi:hypothetical protein
VTISFAAPDCLIVSATENGVAIALNKQSVSTVGRSSTPDGLSIAALKYEIALIR